GRAADGAEAAIDAWRRQITRRRHGSERRRRPGDAHRLGALGQHQPSGVDFVRTIRIPPPLRAPRIAHRPRDLQRLLDLVVIVPHFLPADRPIGAVAELAARLEPLGPEAQRHHGEMDGAAADRLAAVVAAELQRVLTVNDALVRPIELRLLRLVGGEILERPPIWSGVHRHYREAGLGQTAGERAATGAGADDDEVDFLVLTVLLHRDPAARTEHIGRATAPRARHEHG